MVSQPNCLFQQCSTTIINKILRKPSPARSKRSCNLSVSFLNALHYHYDRNLSKTYEDFFLSLRVLLSLHSINWIRIDSTDVPELFGNQKYLIIFGQNQYFPALVAMENCPTKLENEIDFRKVLAPLWNSWTMLKVVFWKNLWHERISRPWSVNF